MVSTNPGCRILDVCLEVRRLVSLLSLFTLWTSWDLLAHALQLYHQSHRFLDHQLHSSPNRIIDHELLGRVVMPLFTVVTINKITRRWR
jgi:hypothetical protein